MKNGVAENLPSKFKLSSFSHVSASQNKELIFRGTKVTKYIVIHNHVKKAPLALQGPDLASTISLPSRFHARCAFCNQLETKQIYRRLLLLALYIVL